MLLDWRLLWHLESLRDLIVIVLVYFSRSKVGPFVGTCPQESNCCTSAMAPILYYRLEFPYIFGQGCAPFKNLLELQKLSRHDNNYKSNLTVKKFAPNYGNISL